MRSSLLPGLIAWHARTYGAAAARAVFEIANRFVVQPGAACGVVREQKMLAGLLLGARLPEQWAVPQRGGFL